MIAETYRRETMVMSTHVVALALLRMMQRKNPAMDIYRLLHTGGDYASFRLQEVLGEVERVVDQVRGSGGPRPAPELAAFDASGLVDDGLRHPALYHRRPIARQRGDRLFIENRNLLLYYSNRIEAVRG